MSCCVFDTVRWETVPLQARVLVTLLVLELAQDVSMLREREREEEERKRTTSLRFEVVVGELRVPRRTAKLGVPPAGKDQHPGRLRECRDDVGSHGDDGKTNEVRPRSLEGTIADDGFLTDHVVSFVRVPYQRVGRGVSLDVAGGPHLVVDSQRTPRGRIPEAQITAGLGAGHVVGHSDRGTAEVGVHAGPVRSSSSGSGRECRRLTVRAGRNHRRLGQRVVEVDGGVPGTRRPGESTLDIALDVADPPDIIVDGSEARDSSVAEHGTGRCGLDVGDDLGRPALVVGGRANVIVCVASACVARYCPGTSCYDCLRRGEWCQAQEQQIAQRNDAGHFGWKQARGPRSREEQGRVWHLIVIIYFFLINFSGPRVVLGAT